jgi:hypothetical protein
LRRPIPLAIEDRWETVTMTGLTDPALRARLFDLSNEADFAFLAGYFSGYHGVPGLRSAAAAAGTGTRSTPPDQYVSMTTWQEAERSAEAAPLDVLALGDTLTRLHGESCDCEVCLMVQPAVDAALRSPDTETAGGLGPDECPCCGYIGETHAKDCPRILANLWQAAADTETAGETG